jgi:ribosome-binding protein aMBF1 (putative translation factor)
LRCRRQAGRKRLSTKKRSEKKTRKWIREGELQRQRQTIVYGRPDDDWHKLVAVSDRSISKSFGATVRALRVAAGASQEELAQSAELHPTYISMLERGIRNPTLDVAARIAKALALPLPKLIQKAENHRTGSKGTRP